MSEPRDPRDKLLSVLLNEWETAANAEPRAMQKSALIEEIGIWKERVKLLLELARKAL